MENFRRNNQAHTPVPVSMRGCKVFRQYRFVDFAVKISNDPFQSGKVIKAEGFTNNYPAWLLDRSCICNVRKIYIWLLSP